MQIKKTSSQFIIEVEILMTTISDKKIIPRVGIPNKKANFEAVVLE